MVIDAITVPHGCYAQLCNVVFGAIRAHQRAYVFITRKEPAEFVIVGARGDTFNELAMNAKKYLFVAMYEQNARMSDVLEDTQEAFEMMREGLYPPNEPKHSPASTFGDTLARMVLLFVGVAFLTWGALQLFRSAFDYWHFGR